MASGTLRIPLEEDRVGREAARARYRELPLPTTRDEHWRFTDLSGFDPDGYGDGLRPGTDAASSPAPATMLDIDAAGVAAVTEGGVTIEHAPDGIRFELLADDHPLLGTLVGHDEKFAAHNAAMWQHGLLVHVPSGVVVEKPLFVRIANTVEGGSLFWRLLIVAEPHSRFSVVEEYVSATPELSGYSNAAVEIVIEEGAKVEYVSVQSLSRQTWHFGSHHARVGRDAELDWVAGGFGSRAGKVWIRNDLAGQGATSRVTGAYFADGTQRLDYDTFQEHIAPNTTSDFAFKGALREAASAVWRGMIRVEEGAQKTNAYQENRNLLLSKTAHADSIPGLEILANDVRCTHGATLGQVDREQLFYLMARGLPRSEAERLIVRGFFQDVLDRIELAPVREALGAALEARIPRA
ncbi:sufD: FeS assembly protein SufD [Gaiella occulta]|uniref:SufD: FeS assembly protein SufD n=1 Tax=Gaiella occulta TaxID=1002870 RepID=A0A7M2Z1E4_9ACTN|nr:Fe-S cluster assembly protein SufD [Gaiella occulta]RDI75594.1 sufD: FeS assembly protein SufD [Gaiella occulta]